MGRVVQYRYGMGTVRVQYGTHRTVPIPVPVPCPYHTHTIPVLYKVRPLDS